MKKIYLFLAFIGFMIPNILVVIESIETGNIMLWTHPLKTIEAMFANRISSIFSIDLLFAVIIFFIWSYRESKRYSITKVWLVWLCTLLFGLAGAFPLFLYQREGQMQESKISSA
ncbi:DUF2834 domain-containing protein [Flavobacteriaceae bacterium M23B6Z8]